MYTYEAEVVRIIDGDTIEVIIDLASRYFGKPRYAWLELMRQKKRPQLVR